MVILFGVENKTGTNTCTYKINYQKKCDLTNSLRTQYETNSEHYITEGPCAIGT